MSFFKKFLSKGEPQKVVNRHTTFDHPFVIFSPKLGILNLIGESANPLVNEDKNGLSPLFPSLIEAKNSTPVCDVLLLYCLIDANGNLIGSNKSLRELIFDSQAPIVLIASPNSGNTYIAASKQPGRGHANLVMVLDRKGANFVLFFQKLFRLMKEGKTMPLAWVELAPQMLPDGMSHPESPESIFSCEAGHILFK
jgi:hypothetical protein